MRTQSKRYKIVLTERQLNHVTTALFEWSGLCDSEAENPNGGKRSSVLPKVAKQMDLVLNSIHRQISKQKS